MLGVGVLFESYLPQVGDDYVIIDQTTSSVPRIDFASSTVFQDPLTNQPLFDGSFFVASGITFRIDYDGGDGNDVVLTVAAIPAPGAGTGRDHRPGSAAPHAPLNLRSPPSPFSNQHT